ncbi:MAG: hypothetical protein AAF757_19445 [Cyanobacteria bacterium P01_D01_bin.116]
MPFKYRFSADLSKIKTSKSAPIEFYPAIWDKLPAEIRTRRSAEMQLKDIENLTKSIPHKSPDEHTRKAHKRRVYYGKGKKFVKWVNIAETTVNKGHRKRESIRTEGIKSL